jgi:hypothetical protein
MADMVDIIVKLLAKAEGTSNEAERQTYLDKAQQLQTKYAIEQALLDRNRPQGTRREEIIWARFCEERNTKLIKAKRDLASALGRINNCFVVMGHGRAYIQVTGHASDVEMVRHMYASILVQLQTAMQRAESNGEVVGGVQGWRVSYAHAYVARVTYRMQLAKLAAQREHTSAAPGTDLVLADRAALAEQGYREQFGGTAKGKRIPRSDSNPWGRSAGDRDGRSADVGGRKVSGSGGRVLDA